MTRFTQLFRFLLEPFITGIGIIAIWYGIKHSFDLQSWQLPGPGEVMAALIEERDTLVTASRITAMGSALGFIAAAVGGFLISVLLAQSDRIRRALLPYVIFMQMIPIIASAAIVVLWLNVGLQTVAAIAFLISFFPIVANTVKGLVSISQERLDLFRIYRAKHWQELLLLRIPAALPDFFTGLRIAATLAVIGSVTGEIFAGSSQGGGGLGFMIIIYKSKLETPALFAATFLCCLLGFAFVGLVQLLRNWALQNWDEARSAR